MNGHRFRYFAIFGAMRTGSNLLERSLNQFDGLHCFGELFNPAFIGKEGQNDLAGIDLSAREADPEKLIEAVIEQSPDALIGFRIFQDHDARIMASALADPACARIILTRNPIDSYVSLKIARQTDQWMLGNVKKRKTATVAFDPDEFQAYRRELDAYYAGLRQHIQMAGMTAFELRFEDIKDLRVLNGLGAFLGANKPLETLDEPIKRQNPEPLHQKLSNYDEVAPFLDMTGTQAVSEPPAKDVPIGKLLETATRSDALLYLPVPGVSGASLATALASDALGHGFESQGALASWLEDHPNALPFTMVTHPVTRAYDVFLRRIFFPGPDSYPRVRRRLSKHHGVTVMDDGSIPAKDQVADAFEAFCVFLKANLAGQTGIRIDPDWNFQSQITSTLNDYVPLRRILKPQDVAEFCSAHSLQVTHATPHDVPLADIYSKRIENLLRAAYARDYRKFGFGPWSGGL